MIINMGCLPPKKDLRDYKIAKVDAEGGLNYPAAFQLDISNIPVKNQRAVSSCVPHATSVILEYHTLNKNPLSTNFIYGGQKWISDTISKGMYLRDACKIVHKYGDPLEANCPGNNEVPMCLTIAESAFKNPYIRKEASEHRILSYVDLEDPGDIKHALMNYGPVLACVKWYKDIKADKQTGEINSTLKGDYGYHAIVIYGWNEEGFLIRNSWGSSWGKEGCAIWPYHFGIVEAKGLRDDPSNEEIVIPAKNTLMDIIYRIANFFINLFSKK